MKSFLLALSVLLFATTIKAQETPSRSSDRKISHAISISMATVKQDMQNYPWIYPYFDCLWYPTGPQKRALPGLSYAMTYKSMFVRAGLNGMKTTQRTKDDYYSSLTTQSAFMPFIGAGGMVQYKKLTVLYGLDAVFQFDNMLTKYDYTTQDYDNKQTEETFSYGASPFIGLSYKLTKRLGIAAESSYRIDRFERESKYEYATGIPTRTTSSGVRSRSNLVSQIRLEVRL
jgi:hypothetical protein